MNKNRLPKMIIKIMNNNNKKKTKIIRKKTIIMLIKNNNMNNNKLYTSKNRLINTINQINNKITKI